MTGRDGGNSARMASRSDDGFGLVEIVVSMFLLAVLAVSFLPLLINALQASVRNATAATATQLVSEQLDAVSLLPRTCAALSGFSASSIPPVTDDRGGVYRAFRSVASCPASGYPAAVRVRVWVTVDSAPGLRIEAETMVIVESAN